MAQDIPPFDKDIYFNFKPRERYQGNMDYTRAKKFPTTTLQIDKSGILGSEKIATVYYSVVSNERDKKYLEDFITSRSEPIALYIPDNPRSPWVFIEAVIHPGFSKQHPLIQEAVKEAIFNQRRVEAIDLLNQEMISKN